MNTTNLQCVLAAAAFGVGALAANMAAAGSVTLYQVGTADFGPASAGYAARAQDSSTVFPNRPACRALPVTR